MGPAKKPTKPVPQEATEITFSEATWTKVILTNVGKFAGVLITIAIAVWQFGQTVQSNIAENATAIKSMRLEHEADMKQLNEQIAAYREWNKSIGRDVKDLETTVAYMKGTIGIPRSAQQYSAPPSPKAGDGK